VAADLTANFKSQQSTSRQIPSPKPRDTWALCFEIWSLVLFWMLEVGIWMFRLNQLAFFSG
jgi:hypothetical protein